jgi:hypothetical protein
MLIIAWLVLGDSGKWLDITAGLEYIRGCLIGSWVPVPSQTGKNFQIFKRNIVQIQVHL